MKRTQERWNNPHPSWDHRLGVSGAKEFDGEDLSKRVHLKIYGIYKYIKQNSFLGIF
jgi:hypothetical protein